MLNIWITIKEGLKKIKQAFAALRPYRRGFFVLLIPLSLGIIAIAAANPSAVETIHSRGAYRAFREIFGRIFGWLPFSLSEIILYLLLAAILLSIAAGVAMRIKRHGKGKQKKGKRIFGILATAGCAAGITYFIFTIFCGLNYHRTSFADQSGLLVRPSSSEELAILCEELAITANELRLLLDEDKYGVMTIAQSKREYAKLAPEGMANLSHRYPALAGYTPDPKPVLASRGMSMLQIAGIYIPFTFEANINIDAPDYSIAFSMLHELAHYKGFMREDEANFIAYLACREVEDISYRYSAAVTALSYTGKALAGADAERYREITDMLEEGVLRDLAAGKEYWKQFEGPLSNLAMRMNDTYLRANKQLDGVKSYGRMVDLLLADYRARHGLR